MKKVLKNGDIISIPITGFGNGIGTANNVEVTITYPDGVSFLDFGDPGNYVDNGTDGVWSLGNQTLNFSETETIRFTVTDSCELENNPIVEWEIAFDGLDHPITNNATSFTIDDISCCQVMACVDANAPEQYKQVWVDSHKGSDDTGLLQHWDKPYQTIQAALSDIVLELDTEEWTVNIRGYFDGVQADLVLPNKCILNFENVKVENDFVLDAVGGGIDMAYITGLLRTEAAAHALEIKATQSFCLKDLILINDGVADIIQDDVMEIYSINVSTNGNIGFGNLVVSGDAFRFMPTLV